MNKKIQIKIKNLIKIKTLCLCFCFIIMGTGELGATVSNPRTLLLAQVIKEKRVTLSIVNKSLSHILREIQKQTGIGFGFSKEIDLKDLENFSIQVKGISVEEALTILLKNTNYCHNTVADRIAIEKVKPQLKKSSDDLKTILLKGKVIDDTNKPVVGATVLVSETTTGSITDDKGNFSLSVPQGQEIEVSCVGFVTYKKAIKTEEENLLICLTKALMAVDEVVVTGYFNRNKESFTGSSVQIKSEDLKRYTTGNVLNVLSIFDPSFRVVDNNLAGSDPNSLPEFNIRGRSGIGLTELDKESVNRNNLRDNPNMPTFILDGFEVSSDKIFDMDIDRIESITILKDAAATAIYGSRAANGVVVIKTITPKIGKFNITYNFNAGVAIPDLTDYDLLNASEKLQLEKDHNIYSSPYADLQASLTKEYNYKLSLVKKGVDTYWLSQPLRVQFNQKHSIYADGGDGAVRYGINFSYNNDNGVMKESARNRGSLGFTFNYNIGDKFRIRNVLSADLVRSKNSPYGSFDKYAQLNPYYPVVDENGNLIQEQPQMINTSDRIFNPVYEATLGNRDEKNNTQITDHINFEWNIIKGLSLRGDFAYNMGFDDTYRYVSPESLTYYDFGNNEAENVLNRGEGYQYNAKSYSWDTNLVLNYYTYLEKHLINFVAGGNLQENGGENVSFGVKGFPSKMFDYVSLAKEYSEVSPSGNKSQTRLAGMFLSLNYSYDNRYLLDLSYRMDGSSVYGSESKFAPFWGAGIGWNIHREKFMEGSPFDMLKIRGSVGSTGKAGFAPYQSRTMFEYMTQNWYATGIGVKVMAIGNENLKWEITDNYDIGIDIALFKNRLSLGANYYIKKTKNLLSDVTLPLSTGFESYSENLGQMENRGYEIYFRAIPYKTKDIYLSLFVNMAHNKNKIMKISNSLDSYNSKVDKIQEDAQRSTKPMVRYREGESISAIYAMKSLGIDPATGRELYMKRDGSLTYDWDAREQIVLGDSDAKLSGAFGLNVSYKQIDLNVSCSYRFGGQAYNSTLVSRVENANIKQNVDRRVYEQRWQKPGDIVRFKDIKSTEATQATSRFLQDENVFEMSSVSLSYNFEKEWIKHIGMQNLRFTAMYNNPFRFSTIKQERGINYPFARNMSFSLMVQF